MGGWAWATGEGHGVDWTWTGPGARTCPSAHGSVYGRRRHAGCAGAWWFSTLATGVRQGRSRVSGLVPSCRQPRELHTARGEALIHYLCPLKPTPNSCAPYANPKHPRSALVSGCSSTPSLPSPSPVASSPAQLCLPPARAVRPCTPCTPNHPFRPRPRTPPCSAACGAAPSPTPQPHGRR